MAYEALGVVTAEVGVLAQEQNQGPERLFEILEEAVIKPDEALLMNEEELKRKQELVNQAWDKVRKWLWANESEEKRASAAYVRGNGEVTPLHLMCKLQDPPSDLVNDLVEAAPEVAGFADSHGWLPLHHACANGASSEVLKFLIMAYPESKLIQDNQNRTPLHFYATRNSDRDMTENVRILCDTGAAELADRGGMLPMHYASAYGSNAEVLKVLAEAFPESLSTKDNKGKTPMHLTMVNAHRDSSPDVLRFLFDAAGRETVNLRDTEGNLPLHLLNLGLRGIDLVSEEEKLVNVSECLKIYLAAKPKPSADFLAEIQNLPDELQDVAVICPHVRDLLNKKIVRRFPTFIIFMDIFAYLLLIVCFEFASEYHIRARFHVERAVKDGEEWNFGEPQPVEEISHWIVYGATAWLLLREFIQVFSLLALGLGIGSWVNNIENWIDIIVIAVPGALAFFMLQYDEYVESVAEGDADPMGLDADLFRGFCAFGKMVLWVVLIFYLKSISINFAVFIDGLLYVVRRLTSFFFGTMMILLGFALIFFILYQETDQCKPDKVYEELQKSYYQSATSCEPMLGSYEARFPHCTWYDSLLKVYTMMMGEIGSEKRYDGDYAAQVVYLLYVFIVVILLSNVLIAIVTDNYEFIQNDRAAIVFWTNRLDFVAEMDGIMSLVRQGFFCCRKKQKGAAGAPTRVQETPTGTQILDIDDDDEAQRNGVFATLWAAVTSLFSENQFYEDEQRSMFSLEFWFLLIYQGFAVLVVIPVWLILGLATCGLLWPPQVREKLFKQGGGDEDGLSRERQKLEQLKEIQDGIETLREEIHKEIADDRYNMTRMKQEVENVQNEVLSDLQQIKELMTTLLDLGGMTM